MRTSFKAQLLPWLAAVVASAAGPDLLSRPWPAQWIAVPGSSPFDYGVYHFRRSFDLTSQPSSFIVHVSADNRYQLFVNGERVAWGPARGDLYHWRYETVDIARQLRPGRNVLAAVVWNDGRYAAVAQTSHRTAFLLQAGNGVDGKLVNSGKSWRSAENKAYKPIPITYRTVDGYVAIPPGEEVDGLAYPWGWHRPGFDDSQWRPAEEIGPGAPRDAQDAPNRWMLVPRAIPMMEERPERLGRVRRAQGITPPQGFPKGAAEWTIPGNTSIDLLLDQGYLTTAFPELLVSGGRGARVALRYAEALRGPDKSKGNRDEVEGRSLLGYQDVFLPDGGERRLFRPLWWRTYRYIEMKVQTTDQPLTVVDLGGVYTGYPFVRNARFEAGSEELQRILDTGWRTARLCAHETYMDCPYYEQLQYVGDTRIQALVSIYSSGDSRLMRNAIEQLDASRTAEGATYSRAPSALQQYIPPFSLWWIGMIHDYWWYVDDPEFARRMLPGVRAVLSFFGRYQTTGGALGRLPWWNFVDWVERWPAGVPPLGEDGSSASLNLQLLLAYRWASDLEEAAGSKELAALYRAEQVKLEAAVRKSYWVEKRGLFADTPKHDTYSQHANALAVLAGLVKGGQAKEVMEKTLAAADLARATIYFRYYLHLALRESGLGDRYLEMLGPWRNMLAQGLTTWAETDSPGVRSDCHAWGASPNIELFRTVLGIDSMAPGFRHVRIRPQPGKLTKLSGAIPHPKGEISVALEIAAGRLQAEVRLPPGVTGEFDWRGDVRALASGVTKLEYAVEAGRR